MKKYYYLFVLLFILAHGHLYGEVYNLEQILPQLSIQNKRSLLNGEAISRHSISSSNKTLQLLPDIRQAPTIRSYIEDTNPSAVYEVLFFIANEDLQEEIDSFTKKSATIGSDPTRIASQQNIVMLHYYNILRKITLFDSIEYTNLKDKNVHPLFLSSHRIIGKKDKTIIPVLNPVRSLTYIKVEEPTFVLQDVPPFGKVISQYTYVYSTDNLSFIGKNLSFIGYLGFTAVRPQDMFTSNQIARTNKGVIIYGLGTVKISGLGVLFEGFIGNSFVSRMVGFFNWSTSQ